MSERGAEHIALFIHKNNTVGVFVQMLFSLFLTFLSKNGTVAKNYSNFVFSEELGIFLLV